MQEIRQKKGLLQVTFSFVVEDQSVGELLQSITTLSTTEAEYIAVAEARKEAVWINGLTREFGITQSTMVIRCDIHSAIYLAKNQSVSWEIEAY